MSDHSDIDDAAHERMLQSVTGIAERRRVKRETAKTTAEDLLNAISSKKNLAQTKIGESSRKRQRGKETLSAPLHRLARDKLQGAIGYIELKKEISAWNPIVEQNRVADQLSFHDEEDRDLLRSMNAADKASSFYARGPKSDLEREMAKVLGQSKFNLTNDVELTEGEKEIVQAMDVAEAKAKLAQMRKMRALISYKQAADARKAKIKSKRYHRIQKRQKRRQLLKEFDDLMTRDPEAAKEKLKELESQRVFERATLKHSKGNAFNKELRKYASKSKEATALIEDSLRLGRELKSKVRDRSDSESSFESADDDEDMGTKTFEDILKESALEAAKACHLEEENPLAKLQVSEAKTSLAKLRAEKRKALEDAKLRGVGKVSKTKPVFEEDTNWGDAGSSSALSTNEEIPRKKNQKVKIQQSSDDDKKDVFKDVETLFDEAEKNMMERAKKEIKMRKQIEELDEQAAAVDEPRTKLKKNRALKGNDVQTEEPMIDPTKFLTLETKNLTSISTDFIDDMEKMNDDQSQAIANAFADDDVVGEFADEKEELEEKEKTKDIDLSLPGWGSWTGPGITEDKKKKKKFIIKAPAVHRKDKSRAGIIISEQIDQGITKFQPKDVPFPYTRMEDFEAAVRQPIGREWNSSAAFQAVVGKPVILPAGRVVRPLHKKLLREAMKTKEN